MSTTIIDLPHELEKQFRDLEIETRRLKENYPHVNKAFLLRNFELFKREFHHDEEVYPPGLALLLVDLYRNAAFFPDDELKSVFKQIGFTDNELRMFIPLDQILGEMEKIAAGATHFLRYDAFIFIKAYIYQNIYSIVLQWAGYTKDYDGVEKVSSLKVDVLNLYKRRRYAIKTQKKPASFFDFGYDKLFIRPLVDLEGSEEEAIKILLKVHDKKAYKFL
ncbi:MAG: hypothetical protein EOO01_06205 [Chitinophagaceae bacterium]|nr:MAG: hypothetical protein EOO01_06205 [Chitinophagaceae bacterium]